MENKGKNNSDLRKKGTQTSAFGTAGRTNHDASEFYGSKLYADQAPPEPETWIENPIPPENLDRLYCASSTDMTAIPNSSIHLMVTSPHITRKKNTTRIYRSENTGNSFALFSLKPTRSWSLAVEHVSISQILVGNLTFLCIVTS